MQEGGKLQKIEGFLKSFNDSYIMEKNVIMLAKDTITCLDTNDRKPTGPITRK